MTVAGIPFDQIISIINQAGIPLFIGTLVSGIFQYLKISPSVPFVEQGATLINRIAVVLFCLLIQVGFDLFNHTPISWAIIGQMLMSYYAATAAYTHLFQESTTIVTPPTQ